MKPNDEIRARHPRRELRHGRARVGCLLTAADARDLRRIAIAECTSEASVLRDAFRAYRDARRNATPAPAPAAVAPSPFGYRVAADGVSLEADTDEKRAIAMIDELRAEVLSRIDIAERLLAETERARR